MTIRTTNRKGAWRAMPWAAFALLVATVVAALSSLLLRPSI